MNRVIGLLLVLVLIVPALAFSCDLCGCFVPTNTSSNGFTLGLAEQYSRLSGLFLEGQQVPNLQGQFLNSSSTQLFVNYKFNERMALQLNVPLVYRSFRRVAGAAVQDGTASGIGDVLLVGYYVPFQRRNPYSQFRWRVLGGLKFPTGDSRSIGEELSETSLQSASGLQPSAVHGHDIALGTGSWDGLLGTDVYGRNGEWFYTGRIQYALRGRGDFDYRFGNDLLYQGGPGYYLRTADDWALGLQALVSGEHKGEDELGSQKADDTASSAVYLGPGATLGIKQIAVVELSIGFPLMQSNTGFQALPKYRFMLGVTWLFR